ncbi:HAD-IB family hydrolase [Trichothermofontia sichuanensis B231]|uniref:HAD-IB family hydrolase n=1 Tax=Trichothermofontia sichuanensis TaxID=3045816 RepID=UPI002245A9C2|nr:HAD-IB family hydrolase [Trichothermofontia sichuanensis]UZQ55030.1 HAD-IB family hydrolase [Trichothermofontia sichuanensis B231]
MLPSDDFTPPTVASALPGETPREPLASVPGDRPIVAVFDFDGTLTRSDAFLAFLRQSVGAARFYLGIIRLFPILLGYALRLIPNWQAKESVLTYFLKGRPLAEVQAWGQRFAASGIGRLLRPEAVQRLRWHQEQGHRTIVISASLEVYLQPWITQMGIDAVSGTTLGVEDHCITGKIAGSNCYGSEKVVRLRAMLGDLSRFYIYAYGDSKGDRELLAIADAPYYRHFGTASGSAPPAWERGLVLSVIATATLYLAIVLWSGVDQFWEALNRLPIWLLPSLAGGVFLGYGLRFLRWQWYLGAMGYWVPWGNSLRIFLASFALTASPGKAGESIKSLLLKRQYNIPIAPTLAGLFCERFTDALSVVLLICLSLSTAADLHWLVLTIGAVQLVLILLLQKPAWIKRGILHPLARWPKVAAIATKFEHLIDSASTLLKPKILVGSTLLALMAWGLEGLVLYVLFQFLGAPTITPYQAVLIHTASGLLGALTFLPGGIGGTEALLIGLSVFYGITPTIAVTATFLIRLLTLWFAVAIGILALIAVQRRLSN